MAKRIASQIDYMQIPGKDYVLPSGTAFPTSPAPVVGQKFYRTDTSTEYVCTNATGPVWTSIMNVTVPDASDTVKGIVELATDAEAITGTDAVRAVTPHALQAKVATATAIGLVELATDAETITGTDTTRAVTPANVQAKINALVAAAPGLLDTLDEIAAALGDDPNFAATMTTALAGKAPTVHGHALTDANITGTLALTKGGTGATTPAGARFNLEAAGVVSTSTHGALVAGTPLLVTHNLGTSPRHMQAMTSDDKWIEFEWYRNVSDPTVSSYVLSNVAFAANTILFAFMG